MVSRTEFQLTKCIKRPHVPPKFTHVHCRFKKNKKKHKKKNKRQKIQKCMSFDDDVKTEEIESLKAIYFDGIFGKHCGRIEIVIELDQEFSLTFEQKTTKIAYLPSAWLEFSLPDRYPEEKPPNLSLSCSWLPEEKIEQLLQECLSIWESHRPDIVIFTILDYLTGQSYELFGVYDASAIDATSETQYLEFVEQNAEAMAKRFSEKTFACQICCDDKMGDKCSQFDSCGHVFCDSCLRDYFEKSIDSGDVEKVHCPDVDCTKTQVDYRNVVLKQLEKCQDEALTKNHETQFFQPPIRMELLCKLLSEDRIDRYRQLFKKQQFEKFKMYFPKKVVECPRTYCKNQFLRENMDELLVVCPECRFAFCFLCLHSWHGTSNRCKTRDPDEIAVKDLEAWLSEPQDSEIHRRLRYKYGKRTIEIAAHAYLADQLFEKLILDSESDMQKCPFCSTVIQRSDGCNKMKCTQCCTLFCNLCGSELDSGDPYLHFNDFYSPCYKKLFEGLSGME